MNTNIAELFSRVFSSEDLIKKFTEIDDLEDLYKFCLSIKGGYTQDEFYAFIMELIEFFDDSKDNLTEIDENESTSVAGGTGSVKRWLAGGLAAASVFSGGIETFAKGPAENVSKNDTTISQHSDVSKEEVSLATRLKQKLKKAWGDHKGALIAGSALFTLAAVAAGVVGYKLPDWKQSYKKKKEEKQANVKRREETVKAFENEIKKLENNDGSVQDGKALEHAKLQDGLLKAKADLLSTEKGNRTDGVSKFGVMASALAGGSAVIGGISSIWDMMGKGMTKLSGKAKEFTNITNVFRSLSEFVNTMKYNIDIAKDKIDETDFDPEKKKEEFENDLKGIKGQDAALDKVRTFYYGILMERDVAARTDKKGNTANVIVLNGPAGVGKTLTANALAKALCKGKPYSMNGPNELDGTRDIKKDLLGDGSDISLWGGFDFNSPKRGIATYLQNNPEGVVVINEYDKIKRKRATDPHPLDELIRGMLDEGNIVSGGKVIDCSKVTFIFTTNETDASLEGRVKVEGGQLVDPDLENDITGSRTVVLHDKSFLTRFKTVSFDSLDEDAYYEIAKKELSPLVDFMASDMGGGMHLDISDETYRNIAKYTASMQEGARPIKEINRNLGSKICMLIGEIKAKDPNYRLPRGLKLKTSFKFEGRNADFEVKLET